MKIRHGVRAGLGLLAAALLWGAQPAAAETPEYGRFAALQVVRFGRPVEVPDFSLRDLKGEPVAFSGFKGQVVLMNFWTTW